MVAEHGPDAPVPQLAERLLEVPKIIPQDRIQQQTVEQFIDSSEATRGNLAEAEKSLAALMTSQAVSKSSYTQVASRSLREGLRRGVEGMDRGNASAPIGDGWSRRTHVLTVPGKSKCCFTDTDRSQRIRYDDSGQTARRAEALNCARSAGVVHLCNHEVWCRR